MCTVSLVPHDDFLRVVCNRDERRTRPPALAPRLVRLKRPGGIGSGELVSLLPIDPVGGGTWIAVNDAGLVLALLNRSVAIGAGKLAAPPGSRGTVIPHAMSARSVPEALDLAEGLGPTRYEPFRLVAAQGRLVGVLTSDGRSVRRDLRTLDAPLVFTSSSLGDAFVEAPRVRLFEAMVLSGSRSGWLEAQDRFHRHRWPDRPELSVWMARSDARTVSRTIVDATGNGVRMRYEPC